MFTARNLSQLIFIVTLCASTLAHAQDNLKKTTPQKHGAVCDGEWAYKGASYTPQTRTLAIKGRPATNADIGKIIGFGGKESTVEAIENGNIITADELPNLNQLWYIGSLGSDGTDDTDNINAALKSLEKQRGGVLDLSLSNCLISLKKSDMKNGRQSAIVIDKKPGIPITIDGGADSQQAATLIFRWPSYGDAIGNIHGNITDFLTLSNFRIEGVGFDKKQSTQRQSGINIRNPLKGFPETDSHIRIHNLWIKKMPENGIQYSGRGEMHIEHTNVMQTGAHGIFLQKTFDNKLINNTIAATGKTGLRIESAPSTNITGGKIYYTGNNGGKDEADSAAIAIIGKQWRNGNLQLANINLQEIRGSGIYIENAGAISFSNIISQGVGRQIGDQNLLPDIIADIRIKGNESKAIHLNGIYSRGFPLYEDHKSDDGDKTKYHGNKTHFVYIDGGKDNNAPEDISGDIFFMKQYLDQNNTRDFGTALSNTAHGNPVIIAGGGGHNNGRNINLRINDVPLK